MRFWNLLVLLSLSVYLSLAGAHGDHAGDTRRVSPASGAYHLTVPKTWYDATRFDEPAPDEGDRLYLAETETIFEAWRDGRIIGPVLQVSSAPATDLSLSERALAHLPKRALKRHTAGGRLTLTYPDLPYRDAAYAELSVTQVGGTLFYLLYAADRALHLHEAESVARSFLPQTQTSPNSLVGQRAPALQGTLLSGAELDLEAYRGQTVLLTFWATMCYGCQDEMKLLEALASERHEVAVLSVNWGDAPGLIRKFMRRHDLSLPVVLDRTGMLADRFSVRTLPATLVIGPEGVVRLAPEFASGMTLDDVKGWLGSVPR